MGIPGIYKHIGPGERTALSKLAVEHLEDTGRPLRIAIDISIWQFQIQSGQGGKNPALRTLYYRLLRLLALSIQPLFIFDGPHKPPFKRGKKIASGAACLPDFLTKELLKRFGFPYHTAPGEAEAECALFQKEGLIDAVLSEDIDTMMFGCTVSLRNWTAEGTRGNKSPTHVNVYKAKTTKEVAGLDSEGMVLVALMSGGDYIPAGMPGCGPKTACEAAKAGFGRDLCKIPKGDAVRLKEWTERLTHELCTNEGKHFRQKHKALKVPENFPDMRVLGYYTNPAVSSKEKVSKLRQDIVWDSEIKISELRSFVADAFNWTYLSGAKKFIRGLAPALLAYQLIQRSASHETDEKSLEANESAEALLLKSICDRRSHWNTDGMPELRIAYIPNDIVQIDLGAEEEDFQAEDVSEEDEPASGGENGTDRSQSPTKKRGASTYNPTEIEKIWLLETYVKLGVPVMVETWEEDMRDPKKFASRKARAKKNLTKPKAVAKTGAMKALDEYMKITKPSSTRVLDEDSLAKPANSDQLPPVFLAPATADPLPSPRRKALTENRHLLGNKTSRKDNKIPKQRNSRTKTKPTPQTQSPPVKETTTNPWTLSKRPSDTLRFKSPTRYSALGIYAPGDPEYLDGQPNPTKGTQTEEKHESLISPPPSPTPRKRRSRPTTPISDTEPKPITPKSKSSDNRTVSRAPKGLSTPTTRDNTKPSPRKKRSPLEQANELYPSSQLRTPTSLRKETLLDKFVSKLEESLTEKRVNRRLDFTEVERSGKVASPVSDTSSLPSPSTWMSPRGLQKDVSVGGDGVATAGSVVREDKGRRLVALRESLEGAWKHLEPWESVPKAAKSVYSSVEVLDLTEG